MANMRLNANLRTVSFSKTVSVLEELELSSGLTIPSYERGVARLLRYDRHP